MITGKTIGTRIRQARGEITQEELKEMTGLSISSIKNWERGKGEPSLKHLRLIAEKLNTSPMILAFGDNTNSINEEKQMLINQLLTLNEEDKNAVARIMQGLIISSLVNKQ